jgi:membrane-bound lytic murein transglycosylase D
MNFLRITTTIKVAIILLGIGIFSSPSLSYASSFWGPSAAQYKKYAFWYQLRDTFAMKHHSDNSKVTEQIHWFHNHQHYLARLLTKAAPYMYYVFMQVKTRHLPGELVLMPIVESAYDPFAYSEVGAAGLWQLMPGTASGYGLKQDWWYDGRRDIYASTGAALDYLTYLQNFFNGNWVYAMASYNAGEGTVQNAIEYNARHNRATDFWELPLPSQTAAYVPRILALAAIIADPGKYGITLPVVKDAPYFASVDIGTQIDLATAANLAGIKIRELYKLNPGYNRWATDPDGPYRLMLPIDKIDSFKKNLAELPTSKRVTWNRYKVRPGDSLNLIAHKFHTRVALLQEVNKLYSNIIKPDTMLLIPRNTNSLVHYDFSPELNYADSRQLALGPKRIQVKVDAGDSLWSVAMKYQVKVNQIRFWNHIGKHQPLRLGQNLIIWVEQRTSIPSELHSEHYSLYRNYKVQAGDNLGVIAKRFGTTVRQIKFANHLVADLLKVGEQLKIPPSNKAVFAKKNHQPATVSHNSTGIGKKHNVTQKASAKKVAQQTQPGLIHYIVKPDDTLSGIADHYHVSLINLTQWNQAFLGEYLHPGQILVIYQ